MLYAMLSYFYRTTESNDERSITRLCCASFGSITVRSTTTVTMTSLALWTSAIIVVLSIFAAALPTLMASVLRHMFTAPHQTPWQTGSLRLIRVGGLPAQAIYSQERFEALVKDSDYLHEQGDIWVVSYPKSGTTWTIGILAALWEHPAAHFCGSIQRTTRQFCPQPELPDLGWGDDGFGHSLDTLREWPQTNGRRCFKSHWPSRDFLAPVASRTSKYIYVMRNAHDQMISHWNQVWGMGFHYGTENRTFLGGWETFVDDWMTGSVECGKWFDHVAGWYQRSQEDPATVLFLRYDELKRNTPNVIRKIANHVGMDLKDSSIVSRVMNLTSFERMKQTDESDAGLQFMRWLGVLRTSHIRRGETASGELELSSRHLETLNREYSLKLGPLGVPKDWVSLN